MSTLSVVSDVSIGTISKNNLLSDLDSQGVKYKHISGLNWNTDDPVLLVPMLTTSLFARAASVDLVSLPARTADWVSQGGTLVSAGGAFNVELLNTIFSSYTWLLTVATVVSTTSGGMDRAICSIFCQGPSWVGNQPVVTYLQASSLPYGAKAEYQSGGNVPIFSIAFGRGRVVYLGSDWSTGRWPWQELLRIAVTPFTTTTTTTTVTTGRPVVLSLVDALFADNFESGNLLGDLRNLDLTEDIEAVTKSELFIQLRDRHGIVAVVIPELEVGNLYQAMTPDERVLLRHLVLNGMKLVVNGANRFWRSFDVEFINGLFGWELEHDDIRCETSGMAFLQHSAAAGTPFSALSVPVLPHANAVYCLRRSSIPFGAAVLYADTHGSVWAFMHSYGQGLVVHLGHDWFSPSYQWRRLLWASMVVKGMTRSDPTTTLADEALPGPGQQNVTVSATSTSRTAPWFTVTTTTTTLRNPGCYPDRVYCAVPAEWAWQTYKVEGSADVAACSGTRSAPGNAQIFDLDVADCHHTRSTESGFLIRVVTLLPHYEPGHLVFFPVAPIIECACRSNLAADAQATVLAHVPGRATMTITADYRFAPELTFVMSAAGMELPQGQQPSGSRLYVKLEDKDARAIIAFANVTFSPRDTASDPHSQMVKEDFCPRKDRRLGRTYEEHDTGRSHAIIFSVDAFKFAHFPVIHVFVDAFQCSHAPCGQCESRRLSLAISRPDMQVREVQAPMDILPRRMQEDPTTGVQTLSASVTASNSALVLPAASEEEKWILNDTYKTSTSTGTFLCTFRVFGYSGALGQPFATQMQESLGHIFPEGVQVMRTFRLPREGDVQGVSENEAVMVEFVINSDVKAAQIIGEYSQGRGYENLLTFLKADFLHAGLGGMGDVQVEFGALQDFTPTPELPTSTIPDTKPKLGLMTSVELKTTTTEPSKRKVLATSTATTTAPPTLSATQGTTPGQTTAPTRVTLTVSNCEEKFCIHLEGADVLRDCRISPDEAGEHPSSVQVLANYCPVGSGFLWLDKANRAFSMPAVKFLGSRSVQLHCNASACGDGSCGCGRVIFPVSERLVASLHGSGRVVHVPGLAWSPLELFAETQPPSGSFACNITLLGSGMPEKAAEAVELALRSALYGELREVRLLRAFAMPMEQGESRRLAVELKWEAMMFEVALVSKERPAMPDNFARWFRLEAEKLGLQGLKDANVVVSALLQQPVVKAPEIVTSPEPEPMGMMLGIALGAAILLLCLLSLACWRRKKRCACRDRLVDDPEDNDAGRDPEAVEQPDCNKKAPVPEASSSSTNAMTQESTLGSDDGEQPRSRWARL